MHYRVGIPFSFQKVEFDKNAFLQNIMTCMLCRMSKQAGPEIKNFSVSKLLLPVSKIFFVSKSH